MDKTHKKGYQKMGMIVGGLALLAILVVGTNRGIRSISTIVGGGEVSNPGIIESMAMVIWMIIAGFILYFIIWLMIRIVHRWAQLMGGGR